MIRQELQKLADMDYEHFGLKRPLISEDGRVHKMEISTGKLSKTELGLPWEEILSRAPQFFSVKFQKQRSRESYGKAVHAEFVRIARALNTPPHSRSEFWLCLICTFLIFDIFIYFRFRVYFQKSMKYHEISGILTVDFGHSKRLDWKCLRDGWYLREEIQVIRIRQASIGRLYGSLRDGWHLPDFFDSNWDIGGNPQ